MLSLIPDALRTKYVERDPVEEWADESGRLVLIGEAAHPLLVSGSFYLLCIFCGVIYFLPAMFDARPESGGGRCGGLRNALLPSA